MKILIINGSHRKNGNCFEFANVAGEILGKDNEVSVINLIEKSFENCNGCLGCEEGEECPLKDDFSNEISSKLLSTDILIFATPCYFNMPSAQMVKFIDRTNCFCEYFAENHKKYLVYLTGQTDAESIHVAYDCIKSYADIMEMDEIHEPIINVVRMPEEVSAEVIYQLSKIAKQLK